METAISTLSYFNTSKDGIQKFVDQVILELENGLINPLDLLIYLKSIEKSIEGINSKAKEIIISESDKYSEKRIEYKGAIIEKSELGTKYNYENCEDVVWNKLNQELISINEKKKERETMLKALKESINLVDENSGETWRVNPPIKTSTSGLKVTIK